MTAFEETYKPCTHPTIPLSCSSSKLCHVINLHLDDGAVVHDITNILVVMHVGLGQIMKYV